MRSFINLGVFFLLFVASSSNLFAEGGEKAPVSDEPPLNYKGKDCEGLINGFSSEPLVLDQVELEFFLMQSINNKHNVNFVQRPDSLEGITIEEYIILMLPKMKNDSLQFELIDIL